MNKMILRNTIISVLLIAALMFVVLLSKRSPYGTRQSSFAIAPEKDITRIELTEDDNRISLVKQGGTWLLDHKYETRKSAILSLLDILTGIKIKSPVSSGTFNEEVTDKNIKPVKIRVYKDHKLLRTFIIYRTASNAYGNIMKRSSRSRPFIVYVPGYEEDIGYFFSTEPHFWRPFTVFDLLPSEISSVEVINTYDTASSFRITASDRNFLLEGTAGWDSSRVNRYISYFTFVPFEGWVQSGAGEKIATADVCHTITVMKTTGEKVVLSLWEKSDSSAGTTDSDRLYGKLNTMDDLFIIRYFDIDPLLKKRSYFYQ